MLRLAHRLLARASDRLCAPTVFCEDVFGYRAYRDRNLSYSRRVPRWSSVVVADGDASHDGAWWKLAPGGGVGGAGPEGPGVIIDMTTGVFGSEGRTHKGPTDTHGTDYSLQ